MDEGVLCRDRKKGVRRRGDNPPRLRFRLPLRSYGSTSMKVPWTESEMYTMMAMNCPEPG